MIFSFFLVHACLKVHCLILFLDKIVQFNMKDQRCDYHDYHLVL